MKKTHWLVNVRPLPNALCGGYRASRRMSMRHTRELQAIQSNSRTHCFCDDRHGYQEMRARSTGADSTIVGVVTVHASVGCTTDAMCVSMARGAWYPTGWRRGTSERSPSARSKNRVHTDVLAAVHKCFSLSAQSLCMPFYHSRGAVRSVETCCCWRRRSCSSSTSKPLVPTT